MKRQVETTVEFLKEAGIDAPQIGIVLGTGLGALAEEIEVEKEVSYEDIPNFPVSTVEFHKGKLIYGTINGVKVLAMNGRFHFYEGYSMAEVVFPIRVMKFLGIEQLLISNAAGNMNLSWKKGQLMMITDHINLQPDNPLRGNGAAEFGPLFVDMSAPYDESINKGLQEAAAENNIPLHTGTYVSVAGPNLETKAEYRFLRAAGADVVGMSTVPEIIAANQLELPVSAISVLTDDCDPDNLQAVNIEEIIAIAKTAEQDLIKIFKSYIATQVK
ncbi:MAG: purine-nucleoside phosphorylase [Cytophagales bacterium]|nr:purine-nucleoside phosphorylase [Cytophagales bacterium]